MGFSAKQTQALRRNPDSRHIRTREAQGRELSYLEGWYAISEANRIFGFDGWSRETVESRCVLARENRGTFLAVYTAKVRITVQADGAVIIREGHGTGEGRAGTPGEVHDTALKAAETDATKRALATFGRPFGLELYRKPPRDKEAGRDRTNVRAAPAPTTAQELPSTGPTGPWTKPETSPKRTNAPSSVPSGLAPILRPSRHYGRQHCHDTREHNAALVQEAERKVTEASLVPQAPESFSPAKIDKSVLTFGEPKRIRDKAHLRFVGSQPCLICGRQPADAHHLRFAQLRALSRKVSDEFTVPLCRGHHREVHQTGNEPSWWEDLEINALEIAKGLWEQSRGFAPPSPAPNSDASTVSEGKQP